MFEKVFKCTLICTHSMLKNTLSLLPIIFPHPYIWISLRWSPCSLPIFHSVFPVSLKNLTIIAFKSPKPWSNTIHISSFIYPINIPFKTLNFYIFFIISLEYLFGSNIESTSMFSLHFINTSKVYFIITPDNLKIWLFDQFFYTKILIQWSMFV